MSDPGNFFAAVQPQEVTRQGGDPMLIPRGLESTGTRVRYTRASGLASYIEESEHFHRWEMRYLAMGMGKNPDLAALAAIERYNTGLLHPSYGTDKTISGRNLDGIIERALDREGIHEKADFGTAVHGFTEPGCGPVPDFGGPFGAIGSSAQSFWEWIRIQSAELVLTERFTANDTTMTAGTFDHLLRFPGHPLLEGWVIGDKKTGRFSPHEWAIQLATYAYGDPYDPDDTRPEWPGVVNRQWAIVFQIHGDTTIPHVIDIAAGWEAAQKAAWVRDWHARNDLVAQYRPATFQQRLDASHTRDDLARLWQAYEPDSQERQLVEEKARDLS